MRAKWMARIRLAPCAVAGSAGPAAGSGTRTRCGRSALTTSMAAHFAAVKASSVRGCTCAALAISWRLSKRASSCQMPSSVRLCTTWSSSVGRILAAWRNGSASGLGEGSPRPMASTTARVTNASARLASSAFGAKNWNAASR
jgi:hypothetical protein